MRSPFDIRIGVALGGGAARGLAHVGVLRALQQADIPVHVVTGTSIGALIGAGYAATVDAADLEFRIRDYVTSDEFKQNRLSFLRESKSKRGHLSYSVANLIRRGIVYGTSTLKGSFLSAENFARSMAKVVPDIPIEETRLVFGAVALDVRAAQKVVLSRGSLRRAVAASSAIPGLLPPIPVGERLLVDGGWIDKVPVLTAYRLGADVVIAVDISAEYEGSADADRGVDVMMRANAIRDSVMVRLSCRMADVVVEPAVKRIHWADFSALDRMIVAGDDAVRGRLDVIRRRIGRARRRTRWWRSPARRLAAVYLDGDPAAEIDAGPTGGKE